MFYKKIMPARIPLRVYSGYILIFYVCLSLSLLPFLDSTVIVLFLFNYNTVGTKKKFTYRGMQVLHFGIIEI